MPASAGTKPGALSLVEAGALGDKKRARICGLESFYAKTILSMSSRLDSR